MTGTRSGEEVESRDWRSCARRRIMRLVAAGAATAAVPMGVVGVAFQNAPSAPRTATAEAIRRAVATAAYSPAKIVHVALSETEVSGSGARNSWYDDAWIGYPYGLGPGFGISGEPEGFRQILRHGDGVTVETGDFGRLLYTHGNDYRFPGAELYDARVNTIYELRAELQSPPFDKLRAPRNTGCRDTAEGAPLGGAPAAFSGGSKASDRRVLADVLASKPYLGGPSARPFFTGFDTVAPDLWSPCTAKQVAIQRRLGAAKRVGRKSIGGRPVIEYTAFNGSWTYYADIRSHKPVRLVVKGIIGTEWPTTPAPKAEQATLTIDVRTYDLLPFRGHEQLLSLTAQHPGARIDIRATDYYAAQRRLFPRRRWG